MINEERWTMFINELSAYIEEHHLDFSQFHAKTMLNMPRKMIFLGVMKENV